MPGSLGREVARRLSSTTLSPHRTPRIEADHAGPTAVTMAPDETSPMSSPIDWVWLISALPAGQFGESRRSAMMPRSVGRNSAVATPPTAASAHSSARGALPAKSAAPIASQERQANVSAPMRT